MTTLPPQQVALYLTDTYWREVGERLRAWDVAPGGTLTTRIGAIGAEETRIAKLALMAWESVTGIRFAQTTGSAKITIDNRDDGAWSQSWTNWSGKITESRVNIGADWSDNYGPTLGSYYMQTMVHELGHAIGLGHTGNYNGWAMYGLNNWFDNDSWQMSVMSYFAPTVDDNWTIGATHAYAITPMPADILAAHKLYGTPTGIGAGNTVYGYNTNAPGIYGEIGRAIAARTLSDPVMWTIFDQGGTDTLDFSGDRAAQVIRMGEMQFSDVLGQRGNVGIAHGTVIERAIAGQSHDKVLGNGAANEILGNGGNDSLLGYGGADRLTGGTGNDRLWGHDGNDSLWGQDGADRLWGGNQNDRLDGGTGADSLDGGSGHDTLLGGLENDTLLGGAGTDRLLGGLGNDWLDGGADQDTLNGGLGNDVLRAGAGNDRIMGGGGRDTLYGGAGADLFIFTPADADPDALERIMDFERGIDRIDLRTLDLVEDGISAFAGRTPALRQQRDGTDLRVLGDMDGDGRADLVIVVAGAGPLGADSFLI